jgi:hypothetical protein
MDLLGRNLSMAVRYNHIMRKDENITYAIHMYIHCEERDENKYYSETYAIILIHCAHKLIGENNNKHIPESLQKDPVHHFQQAMQILQKGLN